MCVCVCVCVYFVCVLLGLDNTALVSAVTVLVLHSVSVPGMGKL